RSGLDVRESERAAHHRELGEFIGVVELLHRQMRGGWSQILPERQDLHVDISQISHRRNELVDGFTETENDAGFRDKRRRLRSRAAKQLERPVVPTAVTG